MRMTSLAAFLLPPALPLVRRTTGVVRRPVLLVAAILAWQAVSACGQVSTFTPSAAEKPQRVVTVSLTPRGFEPNRIDMRGGKIALIIENRSRIANLTVQLVQDKHSDVALASIHTTKKADNWHFVTITPGRYVLSVREQPSSQCVLNVSAKSK